MAEYLKKAAPQPAADRDALRDTVASILADVKSRGLDAVREYSRKFDEWNPPSFQVTEEQVASATKEVPANILASLEFAHCEIKSFAQLQRDSLSEFEIETRPGVVLGQKLIPVANVGAYVPGGTRSRP
jgi:sulfopropanediol 3-dehydrogenase